jgi:hypothetical protein
MLLLEIINPANRRFNLQWRTLRQCGRAFSLRSLPLITVLLPLKLN